MAADDTDEPPLEFGTSFRWAEVTDDSTDDPSEVAGRRTRVRALVGACVVGGVIIVVLTVFGVRALVSDLDDRRTSRDATITAIETKYSRQFDACVTRGGATETCSEQAARACVLDPRWRDDEADQLTRTCVFGPRD